MCFFLHIRIIEKVSDGQKEQKCPFCGSMRLKSGLGMMSVCRLCFISQMSGPMLIKFWWVYFSDLSRPKKTCFYK